MTKAFWLKLLGISIIHFLLNIWMTRDYVSDPTYPIGEFYIGLAMVGIAATICMAIVILSNLEKNSRSLGLFLVFPVYFEFFWFIPAYIFGVLSFENFLPRFVPTDPYSLIYWIAPLGLALVFWPKKA